MAKKPEYFIFLSKLNEKRRYEYISLSNVYGLLLLNYARFTTDDISTNEETYGQLQNVKYEKCFRI